MTVDQDAAVHTASPSRSRRISLPSAALTAVTRMLALSVPRRLATPLLVLTWVMTTFGSLVIRGILPARFYLDGHFIESVAVGRPFAEPDRAFAMTGLMYRVLGLTADPLLPSLFGMLVAGVLVASAYASRSPAIPLSGVLLSAGSLVLFTVFFAWYTKETFAALALTGTVLLVRSQAHRAWAVIPLVAYGAFFRTYWLLVVAVYLGLLVVERFRPLRWWRMSLWVAAALTAATVAYAVALGGSLQGVRAQVNDLRDVTDAASMITPLAPPGSVVTDVGSALVIFAALIVPLTLFTTGQAAHAVYAVAILGLWLVPFASAHGLRAAADRGSVERPRRTALSALYLLVAFLTVLAIFEPDYGSYLRHLSSVVPLMVVLVIAQHETRGTAA